MKPAERREIDALMAPRSGGGEFEELVRVVSEGGMIQEWAKEHGVGYTELMQWIHLDEGRRLVWRGAEQARSQWFVQSIIGELKRLGMVDIREAYDEGGALKAVKDIPENVARAIVGIDTEETFDSEGIKTGEVKKVRFSDKLRALELLGKHLQMFIDNTRVLFQGKLTLEDLVCKSVEVVQEVPAVEAITEVESGKIISGADVERPAGAIEERPRGDQIVSAPASAQRPDEVDNVGPI